MELCVKAEQEEQHWPGWEGCQAGRAGSPGWWRTGWARWPTRTGWWGRGWRWPWWPWWGWWGWWWCCAQTPQGRALRGQGWSAGETQTQGWDMGTPQLPVPRCPTDRPQPNQGTTHTQLAQHLPALRAEQLFLFFTWKGKNHLCGSILNSSSTKLFHFS